MSYLVKGKLQPKYASCESHFFSDSFDIIGIGGRGDGTYSVFTNREMGFDDYFESWELIESRFWTDALYTLEILPFQQNRGNGLYVATATTMVWALSPATISWHLRGKLHLPLFLGMAIRGLQGRRSLRRFWLRVKRREK